MTPINPKYWKNKAVLITGGTGYIGSHLAARLSGYGAQVIATGSKHCNLENQRETADYFKSLPKLDLIFHLAAWTKPGEFCLYHSAEQYRKNTLMHVHALDNWHQFQSQARLIGIGSSCMYPGHLAELKEEDLWAGEPHESLLAYAMTKRMLLAGQLAYEKQFNLNSIHIIFATLYGPKDYFDAERSHVVSALIDRFCIAAKKNLPELAVWGDGTQSRECVFIEDQLDAAIIAAQSNERGIFNLGTGVGTTIRTLAETIAEASGFKGKIVYDTTKFVGIKKKVLLIDKAKTVLGWAPKRSLKEGIKETVDWYVKHELESRMKQA